jgi:AcrR family transcriptional regulator
MRPEGTPTRILDAAFDRVMSVGVSRTTVEDVARAAGLTRQTVYRYFRTKDQLIQRLMVLEAERLMEGVRAPLESTPDLEDALTTSVLFCLRFAREHPLLDRVLATDSDTLLPYLTTRADPVIDRARSMLVDLLRRRDGVRLELVEPCADAAVRTVLSYAVTPPPAPADVVARGLARVLAGALRGRSAT